MKPAWSLGARSDDLQPFVVLPLYLDQGISQSVKRFGPTKKAASPSLASRSTFFVPFVKAVADSKKTSNDSLLSSLRLPCFGSCPKAV